MKIRPSSFRLRIATAAWVLLSTAASAQPVDITVWNRSAAPSAPYGPCYDGPTAQSSKLRLPAYMDETAEDPRMRPLHRRHPHQQSAPRP